MMQTRWTWMVACTGWALGAATAAEAAAPVTADAALVPPPVNSAPGLEYADSVRMFQGIPGLERAANGRLWATWYGGGVTEDRHNYVMLATSADDGATWSGLKLVIDPDGPGPCRAFDPCLWHDPQGRLWLFWAERDQSAHTWAIVCSDPGEESPHWSAPRRIHAGIMMNKPTVTAAGRWLLPLALWKEEGSALAVASDDQGASFRVLGRANVPIPADRNCDECMLVERRDGSLWFLVRTGYGIGESFSVDQGVTWAPVARSAIPHTVSRFFVRRLASGSLLLVRHAGPGPKLGRSHLTAFVSDDDGKTWVGGLLLDERPGVSYPDGVQAPDGTLRVIYDYSRTRDKQILMTRFTEADVRAGRIVSPIGKLRLLVNQATGVNPNARPAQARTANADGEPLAPGPAAEVEAKAGEVDRLLPGARLFLDRTYTVAEVPGTLQAATFVRGNITGGSLVCRRPGLVLIATPTTGRNRDSLAADLLGRGFRKVALPEFMLFDGEANVCTLFQRELTKGETLTLGKWGVVVLR